MADWVNRGSYKDLSGDLLPGDPISALVPTSQHGGNQVWSQEHAMTAPGGPSGDLGNDLNEAVVVDPPEIEPANKTQIEPADDGKPQASGQSGYSPPAPAWGYRKPPETVRKPMLWQKPRSGMSSGRRRRRRACPSTPGSAPGEHAPHPARVTTR